MTERVVGNAMPARGKQEGQIAETHVSGQGSGISNGVVCSSSWPLPGLNTVTYTCRPLVLSAGCVPLSAGTSEATTGERSEVLTLGSTLGLVVEGLDALLDELVTLLAELEDVGALDRLGNELLDDLFDDAGGGLGLVKGRGRDWSWCVRPQSKQQRFARCGQRVERIGRAGKASGHAEWTTASIRPGDDLHREHGSFPGVQWDAHMHSRCCTQRVGKKKRGREKRISLASVRSSRRARSG